MLESTSTPTLFVRRLLIDLDSGFARHWNGRDPFMTAFCNALSMSFPVGEQFFIDSVRSAVPLLKPASTDFQLIQSFIGQEATHRYLHGKMNAHLAKQGLLNGWQVRALARIDHHNQRNSRFPALTAALNNLAFSAALEHYTASLADYVISRLGTEKDWFLNADEPLRTLWYWHCVEELEHRTIIFDLYAKLGGGYIKRLYWFAYATWIFLSDLIWQTLSNLAQDNTLMCWSTWKSGLRFLFGKSGLIRGGLITALLRYLKFGFHPTHYGNDALAQNWLKTHSHEFQPVTIAEVGVPLPEHQSS